MRTYHGTHWQKCSLVTGITLRPSSFSAWPLVSRCTGSRNSLIMYAFLLLHLWCFQGGNSGEVNCPDWLISPPTSEEEAEGPGGELLWSLSSGTRNRNCCLVSTLWGSLCTKHEVQSQVALEIQSQEASWLLLLWQSRCLPCSQALGCGMSVIPPSLLQLSHFSPSPMHESEKWKWSRSVMSDS